MSFLATWQFVNSGIPIHRNPLPSDFVVTFNREDLMLGDEHIDQDQLTIFISLVHLYIYVKGKKKAHLACSVSFHDVQYTLSPLLTSSSRL